MTSKIHSLCLQLIASSHLPPTVLRIHKSMRRYHAICMFVRITLFELLGLARQPSQFPPNHTIVATNPPIKRCRHTTPLSSLFHTVKILLQLLSVKGMLFLLPQWHLTFRFKVARVHRDNRGVNINGHGCADCHLSWRKQVEISMGLPCYPIASYCLAGLWSARAYFACVWHLPCHNHNCQSEILLFEFRLPYAQGRTHNSIEPPPHHPCNGCTYMHTHGHSISHHATAQHTTHRGV